MQAETDPQPSIIALAALAALGAVGMHVLIPVLPAAAEELGTTTARMQITITVYMVGLGIGQILYGVLSDKYGRRPVLLAGLCVFVAGLLLPLVTTSPGALLVARFIQSVGACSGLVLGRAMIQDSARGGGVASRLSVVTMVMSVTPMFAPLLGIAVAAVAGWRAVFPVLALVVLGLILRVMLRLPETRRATGWPETFGQLFRGLVGLTANHQFLGYTITGSTVTISSFLMLGALPHFVKTISGGSDGQLAAIYVMVAGGVTTGSLISHQISRRVAVLTICRFACLLSVAGCLLLTLATVLRSQAAVTILGPSLLFTLAAGLVSPNAAAGALGAAMDRAGTAFAGYGFSQMAFGAVFTALPSLIGNQDLATMAVLMSVTCLLATLSAFGLTRRFPVPQRPADPGEKTGGPGL